MIGVTTEPRETRSAVERCQRAVALAEPSQVLRSGRPAMLLVFAVLLSFLSTAAPAVERCPELDPPLQRLLTAMTSTTTCGDYSGVVTLRRGSDMQVMEISQRVDDGQGGKVLARLTGQGAQVLRDGFPTDCRDPGRFSARSGSAPGVTSGPGSVCDLALSYRFELGPGDRIAGREPLRLRAEPRDTYRFGHVFELDADTALVLKATTLGEDARVLEEFQFASLTMEDPTVSGTGADLPAGLSSPGEQPREPNGPAWNVGWLPSGFVATEAASDAAQRKSYSDGLAAFSVFLEPLGVAITPGEGVERQGSTVAYTRGVRLREQPVLITVLGEIPTNTARMVADSVRLQ